MVAHFSMSALAHFSMSIYNIVGISGHLLIHSDIHFAVCPSVCSASQPSMSAPPTLLDCRRGQSVSWSVRSAISRLNFQTSVCRINRQDVHSAVHSTVHLNNRLFAYPTEQPSMQMSRHAAVHLFGNQVRCLTAFVSETLTG